MARFMLDSDICIAFQRGSVQALVDRMLGLDAGEAVLSVISYGELRVGVEKSAARSRAARALDIVTAAFPVVMPAPAIVDDYAEIRAHLERQGKSIGANDFWIAAHARSEGLTLVTGNEREFRRVPGLAVENWAAA
jgi:tRNA(fMet)-specific endonuclease VapC